MTIALPGCAADGLRLTATRHPPEDVTLSWRGLDPAAAYAAVEFATEPGGPYVELEFAAPTRTTFEHPDLMPETTFYYRVRPIYGPASAAVEVVLPPGELDDAAHAEDP